MWWLRISGRPGGRYFGPIRGDPVNAIAVFPDLGGETDIVAFATIAILS